MLDDIFKLSRNFLKTFNKPYRRYFLEKYPLASRFSIITGQRGVGKTTVLIQKILSANDGDRNVTVPTRMAVSMPASLMRVCIMRFLKLVVVLWRDALVSSLKLGVYRVLQFTVIGNDTIPVCR